MHFASIFCSHATSKAQPPTTRRRNPIMYATWSLQHVCTLVKCVSYRISASLLLQCVHERSINKSLNRIQPSMHLRGWHFKETSTWMQIACWVQGTISSESSMFMNIVKTKTRGLPPYCNVKQFETSGQEMVNIICIYLQIFKRRTFKLINRVGLIFVYVCACH